VYAEGLDPEELAFQRLYGPWVLADLTETAGLLDGFAGRWWVTGGWAVEAFTGLRRPHEDVDVSILESDLPALRQQFQGRMHLWVVGSGMMKPLRDDLVAMPEWASQIWIREHALAPWRADIQVNPVRDGRWIFRRDPELDFDLEEITWVAADGIRYLNPEMAIAYKAKLRRPKDDADLAATLPLLSGSQRAWLAATVDRLEPDHPWLELIARD
jgi:hypothetical protein